MQRPILMLGAILCVGLYLCSLTEGTTVIGAGYMLLKSLNFSGAILTSPNGTTWSPQYLGTYDFGSGAVAVPYCNVILHHDAVTSSSNTGTVNVNMTILEASFVGGGLPGYHAPANATSTRFNITAGSYYSLAANPSASLSPQGILTVDLDLSTFSLNVEAQLDLTYNDPSVPLSAPFGSVLFTISGSGGWNRTNSAGETQLTGINYQLDGSTTAQDFWVTSMSVTARGVEVDTVNLIPASANAPPLPSPSPIPSPSPVASPSRRPSSSPIAAPSLPPESECENWSDRHSSSKRLQEYVSDI